MGAFFRRLRLSFSVLLKKEEPVLKSELEGLVKGLVDAAVAVAIKGAAGGA